MNKNNTQPEKDGCSVLITFILTFICVSIPSLIFIASFQMNLIWGHYEHLLQGEIIIAISTILVIVVPCVFLPTANSSSINKHALICTIASLISFPYSLALWHLTMIRLLSLSFGIGVASFFLARWLSYRFSGISPKIRIPLGIFILVATLFMSHSLLYMTWVDDIH